MSIPSLLLVALRELCHCCPAAKSIFQPKVPWGSSAYSQREPGWKTALLICVCSLLLLSFIFSITSCNKTNFPVSPMSPMGTGWGWGSSTEFYRIGVRNGWSCSALVPQPLTDNKVANNCEFLRGKQNKTIFLVVFFPQVGHCSEWWCESPLWAVGIWAVPALDRALPPCWMQAHFPSFPSLPQILHPNLEKGGMISPQELILPLGSGVLLGELALPPLMPGKPEQPLTPGHSLLGEELSCFYSFL